MRRRNVRSDAPSQAIPPRELVSPSDGCSPEMLTAAYDAWVAGLPPRQYPPIPLQRLRRLGPLPLSWSKTLDELETRRAARAARLHADPSTRWVAG